MLSLPLLILILFLEKTVALPLIFSSCFFWQLTKTKTPLFIIIALLFFALLFTNLYFLPLWQSFALLAATYYAIEKRTNFFYFYILLMNIALFFLTNATFSWRFLIYLFLDVILLIVWHKLFKKKETEEFWG